MLLLQKKQLLAVVSNRVIIMNVDPAAYTRRNKRGIKKGIRQGGEGREREE